MTSQARSDRSRRNASGRSAAEQTYAARLRAAVDAAEANARQSFAEREQSKTSAILARVPAEEEAALRTMLTALGLDVKFIEQPTNAELESEAPDDPEPTSSVPDPIPERLREPLPEARLAIGRKR